MEAESKKGKIEHKRALFVVIANAEEFTLRIDIFFPSQENIIIAGKKPGVEKSIAHLVESDNNNN